MTPSKNATALMHKFEGCKLKAYPDPGSKDGKPVTIGWGTTKDEAGKPIALGTTWTQERCDARFAVDLAVFAERVAKLLGAAPTTQAQFDAMVSFAYNVGVEALRTSTLMRLHKEGDYAGAAGQFARWNKNDGKPMTGLTRRRAAEAELYRK
ncbi:MAG: lysozyme [Sphingomonas sp.]